MQSAGDNISLFAPYLRIPDSSWFHLAFSAAADRGSCHFADDSVSDRICAKIKKKTDSAEKCRKREEGAS